MSATPRRCSKCGVEFTHERRSRLCDQHAREFQLYMNAQETRRTKAARILRDWYRPTDRDRV